MLMLGENGTGKSSIVDGVEFFFTGGIDKFKGRGDVHLDDCIPFKGEKEAFVTLQFADHADEITVSFIGRASRPSHPKGLKDFLEEAQKRAWFKSDLLGQTWDLIIVAAEWREDISEEYFEYINTALNQGSSVIIEAFYLDAISEGAVSPILNHCGVQVYPYYPKTDFLNDVILWPLPGANTHPVLTNPNSGMSFTNALDTWLLTYDLGSLMAATGQGDAQLLLGAKAQDAYQDGALAVCLGGQLILQTFSSHSFSYSTMGPLWENYIYNTLQKRYQK